MHGKIKNKRKDIIIFNCNDLSEREYDKIKKYTENNEYVKHK